jgi:hypothetical protein
VNHEPGCEGWHLSEMSCAEVSRIRAAYRADPWICRGESRYGHHSFGVDEPTPDQVCANAGCERTWGELEVARDASTEP